MGFVGANGKDDRPAGKAARVHVLLVEEDVNDLQEAALEEGLRPRLPNVLRGEPQRADGQVPPDCVL